MTSADNWRMLLEGPFLKTGAIVASFYISGS